MSQQTNGAARAIPSPSRRNLLTGASAALVAGVPAFQKPGPLPWRNGPRPTEPVPPGADAELIADIAELGELSQRHDALSVSVAHLRLEDPQSQAVEAIFAVESPRVHELRERIARTPAATMAGARAKARLSIAMLRLLYTGDPAVHEDWDSDEAVAHSALLDLMERAAA